MWKRSPDDKANLVTGTRALETPDGPSGFEQISKNKKIYKNQGPHCWRKEPAVSPWKGLGWAWPRGPGTRWTAGGSECSKYTHRGGQTDTEKTRDRCVARQGRHPCTSSSCRPSSPEAAGPSQHSRQVVWGLTARTQVSLWELQRECGASRSPRKQGCTRKRAGTCQRDNSGTIGATTYAVEEMATSLH